MSSNDQTSTDTSQFRGLWDRDNKSEELKKTAERLAKERAAKGAPSKPKRWGLADVFRNFIALIVVQVVVGLGALWIYTTVTAPANVDEVTAGFLGLPLVIALSSFAMYAVWIGGMWYVTRVKGQNSFRKDFWVQFKKRDILIGLGLAAGLYGFVVLLFWLAGDVLGLDMTGANNGATFTGLEGAWLYLIGFGIAGILGPIAEEFFFRGFLLQATVKTVENSKKKADDYGYTGPLTTTRNFLHKHRYKVAVLFSSIVFGFMHFQGVDHFGQWLVVIVTGTLGLVFGIVTVKLKRIGPAVFGHIFYNSTSMALAVLAMNGAF